MDHHRAPLLEPTEGLRHRIEQVGASHAEHMALRPQGVHQRTQQVEHRADSERAAHRCQPRQGGMPARGKQEGHPHRRQGRQGAGGGGLQIDPEGFKNIGRADAAAGTAIAVLGHRGSASSGGEGHGGADVEAVHPRATGAAGIHQRQGWPLAGQGAGLAEFGGHRRQLLAVDPLAAQGGEQGGGDEWIHLPRQPGAHQGSGAGGIEVATLDERLQQRGTGEGGSGGAHRGRRAVSGQKKARVQGTPGRVMGTFPLSPEAGRSGDPR